MITNGRRLLIALMLWPLWQCQTPPTATPEPAQVPFVLILMDTGLEDDKTFNSHVLKGASAIAKDGRIKLDYTSSAGEQDYEQQIESLVARNPDLVVTVGFRMGFATARAARRHPDQRFAIIDAAFRPGFGCPEEVEDCYTREGGLANVTSLQFAEDQVGYLAGVLAACMSESGMIASVAGPEILPVVRFVSGYQAGARWANPEIQFLNVYLPSFNDPDLGKVKTQEFLSMGADVVFGVGGNSGNGALLVAAEQGVKGIGVDGDQYYTLPEARAILLTSASKGIDTAVRRLILDLINGKLESGIRTADLQSGGVDLAPFHEWESRISSACRTKLAMAREAVIKNPALTESPSY
ncbi:BMP family ABC transporter substrate-binding protein [Acanthopleuribacter pedis]|uniref:BMP family ABC transporter substrate-binding protein n=1 Tax=Acanthopleuribacter pedis TaxID=442870 RepID=A0A8J7U3V3_9BACT|nr:BMP family ABC transporter substrate-binding protein [Acanthopleuribacter pedis]MBO1317661.1 BMP family ABC transporter substrate-binding protein [Acanthopleuribacter pedis]